ADPNPTAQPECEPQAAARRGCFACSGSRTITVVPLPSVEKMRMAPPCSSTSDLAMARPRPEPWWRLVSWLSTCSNGRPSLCSASFDADAAVLNDDRDRGG